MSAALQDRYTLASPEDLDSWIAAAKATLGERLMILGHHYQRDEIIKFADARGDSYKLSRSPPSGEQASTSSSAGCTSWPRARTSSPPPTSR